VSLGIDGRSVGDFLDALVALGMHDRTAGKYRNTPETALFLDRNKPTYMVDGPFPEVGNRREAARCINYGKAFGASSNPIAVIKIFRTFPALSAHHGRAFPS
jgi:hypothetical protein